MATGKIVSIKVPPLGSTKNEPQTESINLAEAIVLASSKHESEPKNNSTNVDAFVSRSNVA